MATRRREALTSASLLDVTQIRCHPADDKMVCESSGNQLLQKAMVQNKLPQVVEGMKIINANGRPTLQAKATVSLQIIVQKLAVESRVDYATCSATFHKIEGTYGVPSGAKVYYSCKSDFSSTTALVECPSGSFNIICTNPEKEASTTVYMAAPKIDEMCAIRCPAHVSSAHLQGHLVHLNDNAGSAAWIKETADINHSSSFVDFILDMSLSSLLKLICLLISLFGLFNASKAIIPRLVSFFIH